RPARLTKSKDVLPLPTSKAKGKRGGRDGRDENLSEYLSSLGRIPLLTADDEIRLASTLKNHETDCWRRLLVVHDAVVALCDSSTCGEHPVVHERLHTLRQRLADGAAVDGDLADMIDGIAQQLRDIDDERRLVEAVVAVADDACARGLVDRSAVLAVKTARRKSLEVRNAFVRANLRLVVSVARRFHHFRMPLIDLIQEGNLGLIKSVHRYDHTKGFRFSTYAHWWIRQAIERAIMNKGAQVRLPVHVFDARREVARVTRDLTHALGREPSTTELANGLGITLQKLNEVLASVPREPQSLDDPIGDDEDRTLAEAIAGDGPAPDEQVIGRDEELRIKRLLTRLSPMEIDIITRRYGLGSDDDETLEEIGKSYALSRERVRQIQVQGLKKIQRSVEDGAHRHEARASF
ncbi:MAG TPA: sigma-70 family RNA polymerase sigma factor, partial [Myxococcota bacterium]